MNIVSVQDAFTASVAGRPVTIVPNCGNAGDSLINHAIYSFAKKMNVEFEVEDPRRLGGINSDRCYLIMANGALVGNDHVLDRVVAEINGKAPMILFSATIADRDELLLSLHESTVIVCRELVTYRYVKSIRDDLRVILSEDATMAIADGVAQLPNAKALPLFVHFIRVMAKLFLFRGPILLPLVPHRFSLLKGLSDEHLSAYRIDGEKTNIKLPKGNLDLSVLLSTRKTDPDGAEAAADLFLRVLKSAKGVKTNRLHIAIGCCLAGVKCDVSANSYFKVRAIFEHSLKSRFSKILKWAQ
ncbi:polysaccharide pyruvyl transferase family protein [Microbulbifer sp. CAU 1566]|uniref:polysaccharide pyruvyl transferase family protein n=1 Tax=Microbulbifer sp. CAU 1566 TaxID=2933269 RepID=UPI0020065895|nr:polysaccharide pyruvyl transferase family protein [Microbulbifer sp. CAU 1566]